MPDAEAPFPGPVPPRSLLIIVPNSLRVGGGQEQDILDLAPKLSGASFRVRVVDFDSFSREEPRFSNEAVSKRLGRVARITVGAVPGVRKLTSIPTPGAAKRLRDLIASSDVVLACPYYGEDAVVALLARLQGRPLVASQNNTFLHRVPGNPREALQDAWNRVVGVRILRTLAGVRTVSADEQATLASFGITRTRVLYVASGAGTAWGERAVPPPSVRPPSPSLPVSGPELRVLVAGRMTAQKGMATLAEVLRQLRHRPEGFSRFRFSFVGTRRLPSEIEAIVREAPDRLVNLGFLPTGISDAFLQSDVLLMPSLYESLGVTAIEAIRFGVPVIASNVSGLREVVRPGETGWLASPQKPGEFVAALDQCLALKATDPARWEGFRAQCRDAYERRFGPAVVESQFAGFVEWLRNLAGNSPRESSG
jgi:glycosyltransferase involved in cell wall biosynthesis